ncbi:MAG: hypothetical protein NUW07_08465, partial [Candidatus Saccharicenans sp.]|nr:hypothetical protein [Candidatus Saccharicenans sp.]
RWLGRLRQLKPRWLFDLPLVIFLLVLLIFTIHRRSGQAVFLIPLTVMGFTTIVAEVALILSFQSQLGLVYSKISLLFTIFMAGLFV